MKAAAVASDGTQGEGDGDGDGSNEEENPRPHAEDSVRCHCLATTLLSCHASSLYNSSLLGDKTR